MMRSENPSIRQPANAKENPMTDTPAPQKILPFKTPEGRKRILSAYQAVLDRWPVPYEEIEIPTRFGMTHIIASGEKGAPPLILVHAFFATAVVWQPNVAAFSRSHRVYAVDCIGEPNPSTPARPISSRLEFAQWWTDVMDFLEIDRADMVGNSNGGFLTLNQALLTPERIRKTVLISPAATFVQMWPFYINFFIPVLFGSQRLVRRGIDWCGQGLPLHEGWEALFMTSLLEGMSINRVFPAVFKDAELKQIQTPTLLLVGDHEVIYKPQAAIGRAARLVPGLCAEIIPAANHIAAASNPEWVNERILRFLKE
jgi:pimeloyl-ACP methyl ester carboxylesterase